MMVYSSRSIISFAALVAMVLLASNTSAFAPISPVAVTSKYSTRSTPLFINVGEQERERLTRDSEPEDFFVTNTDKMSDEEKIPIAIAGVAFIALPFIAGLIALYASK